jgi:hypothetical protein
MYHDSETAAGYFLFGSIHPMNSQCSSATTFKADARRALLALRDGGKAAIPAAQLLLTRSPHLRVCVPAGIVDKVLHPKLDALNNQITVNNAAGTVTLRTTAIDATALPGAVVPSHCGDAVCSLDEHCADCSIDCGKCPDACGAVACPTCGDGTCTPVFENCVSCPSDCHACPDVCGDGQCTGARTFRSFTGVTRIFALSMMHFV